MYARGTRGGRVTRIRGEKRSGKAVFLYMDKREMRTGKTVLVYMDKEENGVTKNGISICGYTRE